MSLSLFATTTGEKLNPSKRYSAMFKWIDWKMEYKNWSIKDGRGLYQFPYWLLERVYSKVDMIEYYGRQVKGRIVYLVIPSIYTVDNIPIIVDVIPSVGTDTLPENAVCMSYPELKQVFTNNKFED